MKLRFRWSLQLRLTLLFGVLFLLSGTMLLAITYALVADSRFMGTPDTPTVQAPTTLGGGLAVPGPDLDPGSDPDTALSGQLTAQRERDLQRLISAGAIALGVMTVVSGALGWAASRRALRPLRTMAGTARSISEHNLHERLAITGPQDEVKEFADTVDGLLARLETAFEAQRRFVANASHELRTPLTVERSLVEVALADSGATVADLRYTCERVLAHNEHQERLIEALLTLARSQRGLDERAPLALDEVVRTRAEALDVGYAALRVDASFSPALIEGDRPLVERLATNLLENAVRHNRPSGRLTVWTGMHEGQPALRVSNSGPVIRPEQLDGLFQPFQRLGTAKTTTDHRDGFGIGLSIVEAIATAHGATLEAHAIPSGGLDVLVRFRTVQAPVGIPARDHPPTRRSQPTPPAQPGSRGLYK
ncbi:ATP-binding protein [Actinoplanes sp. NPDC051851]|uniref:sensor histidine kinase n=1 Tax=Actinoplanes sp. NPDC051851 TaxID=3154753 RepID=UPI0034171C65